MLCFPFSFRRRQSLLFLTIRPCACMFSLLPCFLQLSIVTVICQQYHSTQIRKEAAFRLVVSWPKRKMRDLKKRKKERKSSIVTTVVSIKSTKEKKCRKVELLLILMFGAFHSIQNIGTVISVFIEHLTLWGEARESPGEHGCQNQQMDYKWLILFLAKRTLRFHELQQYHHSSLTHLSLSGISSPLCAHPALGLQA